MAKITCNEESGQHFKQEKEGRQLQCYHFWRGLWWCFIFLSWSKSICNAKTCMTRIRGVPTIVASLRRWTPWMDADKLADAYLSQGQALGSHILGWKYLGHSLKYPTMVWCTGIRGRVHWKSSVRKVAHPSSGLRWLNIRVPMGSKLRRWV